MGLDGRPHLAPFKRGHQLVPPFQLPFNFSVVINAVERGDEHRLATIRGLYGHKVASSMVLDDDAGIVAILDD